MGRAHPAHKARAVRPGRVMQDRLPKAGDSIRRVSTTVAPSAPDRVAEQDAPVSADLARLAAASAGHDPPAVAGSAVLAQPGREGSGILIRVDPEASPGHDPGHAPAASAGHDPPAVAGSAVLAQPGREGSGILIRVDPEASPGHDPGHAPAASAGLAQPAVAGSAVLAQPGREGSGILIRVDPEASLGHDPGHAPAASAGHGPPAVAGSAVLVPPGREGSGILIRVDPEASAGHDLGDAPAASTCDGPPVVAGIAISDRVGRVRPGRAMATGRPHRASVGPGMASPMKLKGRSARQDVSGDPLRAGLPDRLGRKVTSRKLLILRVSKLRRPAPTSDGIPSNVLVRPGRAHVHVPISVAHRARSGQALGSVAADHRACLPHKASKRRSVSTGTRTQTGP